MKHKIKVVTLPTEDTNPVTVPFLITPKGKIYKHLAGGEFRRQIKLGSVPHHVYITVSHDIDTIKVGDFILAKERFQDGTVKTQEDFDNAKWKLEQVSVSGLVYVERTLFGRNNEKGLCGIVKIIASSDPKLTIKEVKTFKDVSPATKITTFDTVLIHKQIPQVQQSFLKEFVANPNGEFEVEYEIDLKSQSIQDEEESKAEGYMYAPPPLCYKLKLNHDNTVNITSVKEMKLSINHPK